MLKQDVKILSMEDISAAFDLREQIVECPEWGGAVRIRAWSLEERDRVMAQASPTGKVDENRADPIKLIHLCVVHGVVEPKGLTLEMIRTKSWIVIDRIATAVMELNGLVKGATLSASMTFRPDAGSDVSVSAGPGPGHDGLADPVIHDGVGVPTVG